MEKIKEILGEEVFNKLTDEDKTKVQERIKDKNIIFADEGEFIPKDKFDEKLKEAKSFKDKVAELEDKLEEISAENPDNKAIEDLKNELKEEREKNRRILVKQEVIGKIKSRERKPLNEEDVLLYLGEDIYNLEKDDENNFIGLAEKLEKLEEERPHWFESVEEDKPLGTGGFMGNTKPPKPEKENLGRKIGKSFKEKVKADTSAYEI